MDQKICPDASARVHVYGVFAGVQVLVGKSPQAQVVSMVNVSGRGLGTFIWVNPTVTLLWQPRRSPPTDSQ